MIELHLCIKCNEFVEEETGSRFKREETPATFCKECLNGAQLKSVNKKPMSCYKEFFNGN